MKKKHYLTYGRLSSLTKVTIVGADAFLIPYRGGRERLSCAPAKIVQPPFCLFGKTKSVVHSNASHKR